MSLLKEVMSRQMRVKIMVTLKKMTEKEFLDYKEFSISEYAQDLTKGKNISYEQARIDAKKEFEFGLPNGLDTKNSFLMNIVAKDGEKVGWLWFQYDTNEEGNSKQVFLADLFIFESERRKGYASDAINEMNRIAKNDCCSSSALFVWEHNPKGLGLYEKCGYKYFQQGEGGIFMLKEL